MDKDIKNKEEVEIAIDKAFEEYLVKTSHLVSANTDVELLKMFYNQGYLDCLKSIKKLWQDQLN